MRGGHNLCLQIWASLQCCKHWLSVWYCQVTCANFIQLWSQYWLETYMHSSIGTLWNSGLLTKIKSIAYSISLLSLNEQISISKDVYESLNLDGVDASCSKMDLLREDITMFSEDKCNTPGMTTRSDLRQSNVSKIKRSSKLMGTCVNLKF